MSKKRKSIPSKETILSAWWGPLKDPTRKDKLAELTHGKLQLPTDTDRCWSCHALQDWWLDDDGQIDENKNTTIQRCHIVADSLNGSNDPLNFVLLCERCHRRSPDTISPQIIFDWLEKEHDNRTDTLKDRISEFKKWFPEIKDGDLTSLSYVGVVLKCEDTQEFKDILSKESTWHFGINYKWSTHYGLLSKFIQQRGGLASVKIVLENENLKRDINEYN